MRKGVRRACGVLAALLVTGAASLSHGQPGPAGKEKSRNNGTVIAPGSGSDGIMLGEEISAVINRFGTSRFTISKPERASDLFAHVFKIAGPATIIFDTIYNNEERKCAACVFRGKVVAVIGFESERATADEVNLQSGAENFIFNYGNRGLRVLSSGTNRIYCYPGRGIAVVDDDMNDTIDLYFVFSPARGAAH